VDHQGRRWRWICMVAAGLFLVLAATVRLAGIPAIERQIYAAITSALPDTPIPIFRWITRLGSETILFPASVFLIILCPGRFFVTGGCGWR